MDTTILPTELWEIIAEDWRIWRCLQQCNRHLAAIMSRIDPYRKYVDKVVKRNTTNVYTISWIAGDVAIKRVVVSVHQGILESYRNGHNYFSSLYHGGSRYFYSQLDPLPLFYKFIRDDGLGVNLGEVSKEEMDALRNKYKD